jgi:hypothetical protein
MIYPSIQDLTRGKYNRYTLVIATAKCARMVTDEYVKQREVAERMLSNSTADQQKSLASMIKREYCDDKAVRVAISRLYSGEFKIVSAPTVITGEHLRDGFRKTIRGAVYGDDDEFLNDDLLDDDFGDTGDDVADDNDLSLDTGFEDDIIDAIVPDEEEEP